jgi:hypothetical protein
LHARRRQHGRAKPHHRHALGVSKTGHRGRGGWTPQSLGRRADRGFCQVEREKRHPSEPIPYPERAASRS